MCHCWSRTPQGKSKQTYKLELSRSWKIHDMFHMSLLEQDTPRKGQEFSMPEFELNNDKEYEVEVFWDSVVYAKEANGHLPELYYLVAWKGYPRKENTWEPFSAVMHLRKMVSTCHKDNPEKPTVSSVPLDSAPPMAKPTIQLLKWKRGQPTGRAKKRAKTYQKTRQSEATKKRRQKNVRVNAVLEPKAGE